MIDFLDMVLVVINDGLPQPDAGRLPVQFACLFDKRTEAANIKPFARWLLAVRGSACIFCQPWNRADIVGCRSSNCGIADTRRPNDAATISETPTVLNGDKKTIFTAASKASQAVDYLDGLPPADEAHENDEWEEAT